MKYVPSGIDEDDKTELAAVKEDAPDVNFMPSSGYERHVLKTAYSTSPESWVPFRPSPPESSRHPC